VRLASSVCVVAAAIVAGGCGTDVDVGGALDGGTDAGALVDAGASDAAVAVDAPADVPDLPELTPFPDGTWTMTIAPTSSKLVCSGSLAGRESDFTGITRDDVGFVGGDVILAGVDATHLTVSGAPIETGYGAASLSLEEAGGPTVPDYIWIGVTGTVGAGPTPETMLIALALHVDDRTITPEGFDGLASALYAHVLTEGECTVGFAITFTR
jgi:hypothetical protein